MIIRNVAMSIRQQNWGTLLLELLVVVIGIFLGLQVDDWNESRKQAEQEVIYLERLLVDANEMISAHEEYANLAEEKIAITVVSLDALERCDLSVQTDEALSLVLLNHQGLRRLSVVRTTYEEMLASGALARIESIELKNSIAGAFAYADEAEKFIEYFTADLGRASGIIWKHVAFHVLPESDSDIDWGADWRGEEFSQSVSYDFQSLCNNPVFINAIVEVFDSTKDRLGVGGQFAQRLEKLVSSLEVRLGVSES